MQSYYNVSGILLIDIRFARLMSKVLKMKAYCQAYKLPFEAVTAKKVCFFFSSKCFAISFCKIRLKKGKGSAPAVVYILALQCLAHTMEREMSK